MSETYKIVQRYSLKKLSIISIDKEIEYDLSFIFKDISLYHSIDDVVTSGNITIQEQGNLVDILPIVGRERIDIEFTMMDGQKEIYTPYKRSFWVYAVDSIKESSSTKTYKIHFTDICGIINNNNRLSIKYEGKVEDIFDSISKTKMFTNLDYLSSFADRNPAMEFGYKTKTAFEMIYVSPNWKPLRFMKRIASEAVSTEGDSLFNDCLFFQQIDGKYEFNNYHNLFSKEKEKKEFKYTPNQIRDKNPVPVSTGKYNIESYDFSTMFNTQASKISGMMGTTIEVLDFKKNKHQTIEQTYDQTFNSLSNNGYFDAFSKNNNDKKFKDLETSTKSAIFYSLMGFNTKENIDLETTYLMPIYVTGIPANLNQNVVNITFELSCAADIRLGDLIEITGITTGREWITGVWCISKIRHYLTQEKATTYVECFKNIQNRNLS